ncbi:MAG TPA: CFI-box-CTERM domain-containing protein [Pyrinomonadaceae bacterium]|nr:CFI-box-CTERM domain-containing protein [Pyrinomonadaceae bacterium]
MTMFLQTDATGAGSGSINQTQGFVDLAAIANGDTGLGLGALAGNRQQVNYNRTDNGVPATRLGNLVSTAFNPDYGLGAGPQAVNIIVIPAGANFVLNSGTLITTIAGTALPPNNSGLGGATSNTTNDCLVIYDTSQNSGNGYCVARAGTSGTLDLDFPGSVLLYHELSHAFRIVNNTLLALGGGCNPSSPEENAAITDENDQRTQRAAQLSIPVVLRDPGIHCGGGGPCGGGGGGDGGCCIVATTATGSGLSDEVQALRSLRDGLLRKTEVGFSFFQTLHRDYYGFSPQVCTLMAQHPPIRLLVLEGFVRPLVTILRLVEHYAVGRCDSETLGHEFVAQHDDQEVAAMRLVTLARARQLLAGSDAMLTDEELKLVELLAPALLSEHVRWALIEPLEIYETALLAHLTESGVERIGTRLYEDINAWAGRMPLDAIWGALAVSELGNELKALDTILLRTPSARTGFRHRLKGKFGDITAVVTVLDAEQGVNT